MYYETATACDQAALVPPARREHHLEGIGDEGLAHVARELLPADDATRVEVQQTAR